MGLKISKGILFCSIYLIMMLSFSSASVVLIGTNFTVKFDDIEANFAPPLGPTGMCGRLYMAEPINACSPLKNSVELDGNCSSPIALIVRGGCSFENKIRRAQNAGFEAVIIYNNEDGGALVAMAGNSAGINIHAVFVSKATGHKLRTYADPDVEVWMFASYESSAWSIMAISFISLLAMSAVLATCFFVRRHRVRRERPQGRVREFHGMSSRLVKAMPSLVFTSVTEENCTASICAICLEDYRVGDKLRILPCRHKFHTFCVDAWLTSWRTFCPVCKRDARTSTGEPPASESTPLLSSNPSSAASSPFSSFRSSSVRSSAIQIASPSPRSRATSHYPSVSSSPQIPRPLNSYHNQHSPSMSLSRSSLDLRNMSSQRSYASQFYSPGSLGYPSASPLNTRYVSPYVPSPSNASSSYLGSSSMRYPTPLHYSESAASFSPYSSAQSLPGC
ncbi:receptor homology region, transmembrane domain- and RING domain-containing protein 2-like [Chenopodium quinoa]|uniref:RING-type domain-containing protein n=1 Tax=Chenopodium quinoa TaxID=63459 RepID=A0A803M399_CHEQI|nr:receptor homology region, transmembrane domain- and RING domain-containing protein 2-like [Chenopodium quinoa]XP_021767252.1 receptor homology region, transmembrane domain- and RING domain-containing protein 2-like [Chenopodium quinoa]